MQWSELVAAAGVGVFLLIVVAIIGHGVWRTRQLEHEERRLMIEKGMVPPPRFTGGWPQVKQQEVQARFEERRLMIEKGMIPPASAPGQRWERDDFLRRGIVMFFLGIGLGITYYLLPEAAESRSFLAYASPGLAMVGLGCLAYYGLSAKSAKRSADAGQR
jgi:hypothetical protein